MTEDVKEMIELERNDRTERNDKAERNDRTEKMIEATGTETTQAGMI